MKYKIDENCSIQLTNDETINLYQEFDPTNYDHFTSTDEALNWGVKFLKESYNYDIFTINIELFNELDEAEDSIISGELTTIKFTETSHKLNGSYSILFINKTTGDERHITIKFVDGIATKRTIFDSPGDIEVLLNNVFTIGEQSYVCLYQDGKYNYIAN